MIIIDKFIRILALLGVFNYIPFATILSMFTMDDPKSSTETFLVAFFLFMLPAFITLVSIFKPYSISKNFFIGSFFAYLIGILSPILLIILPPIIDTNLRIASIILLFFISSLLVNRYYRRI